MGSRLFVGNLPYSSTEDDIRALFAERWKVVDVRIVTDRESGRSRGFGFVELDTPQAAQEAISSVDGADLGGRRLAVREAHERGRRPRPDGRQEVRVDSVSRRKPYSRERGNGYGERRGRGGYGGGGRPVPEPPINPKEQRGRGGRRWSADGSRRDRPERDDGYHDDMDDLDDMERGGGRRGRKGRRQRHDPDW